MDENELPEFASVEELANFFDTHDVAEYLDQMPEVVFDVDIQRETYLVAVDARLMGRIADVARTRHTSTEELVNSWLEEKAAQAA